MQCLPQSIAAQPTRNRPDLAETPRDLETLLIVDDEDAVRMLVGRILESRGFTVLSACSADEARSICEQHEGLIHLILTDVLLLDQNGRLLAESVLPFRPGMKAMFFSGYSKESLVQQGLLGGDAHFLQKPFPAKDLIQAVEKLLRQIHVMT